MRYAGTRKAGGLNGIDPGALGTADIGDDSSLATETAATADEANATAAANAQAAAGSAQSAADDAQADVDSLTGRVNTASAAQVLVGATNSEFSAERLVTDTASITWDLGTAGQAKANAVAGSESTAGILRLAANNESTASRPPQSNDDRMTNARTPTAHASSHGPLGSDKLKLDDLEVPDDNTDLDATTGRHGLLRKLSNSANDFLDGQGAWSSINTKITATKIDDLTQGDDNTDLDSSASRHGLLRKLDGNDGTFLSGDGQWRIVSEYPYTAIDLNWTTQGSQLGIVDGNVAINGVNWKAANAAAASTFQILNGSGLMIAATAGSSNTWTSSAQTAPALYVDLDTLIAAAAKHHLPMTIWSYFSAWATPSSSNSIIVGAYGAAGAYTACQNGVGYTHNGSQGFPYMQRNITFTTVTQIGAGFTENVLVWRIGIGGMVDCWAGVYSGGWPSTLTPLGQDIQMGAATINTTQLLRRTGVVLVYAAATRSASGSPSFTLARTRIQIG